MDMTAEMTNEEYQSLTRSQKTKKVLPKVLPVLLLSVILPTADIGTDLALIIDLYTGLNTTCVWSDGILRDHNEYWTCRNVGPDQYCNTEKVSNKMVCGVSQYYCRNTDWEEYNKCEYKVGPDQYCTPEKVSNNICGLKNSSDSHYEYYYDSSDSPYFCRYYEIWSSEWKDYDQCKDQGVDKYCSNQTSNQNVCSGSHPKMASSLLFFFLLNYVMGLVTCIRLEGRKWVPLIAALLDVYPQYCK